MARTKLGNTSLSALLKVPSSHETEDRLESDMYLESWTHIRLGAVFFVVFILKNIEQQPYDIHKEIANGNNL